MALRMMQMRLARGSLHSVLLHSVRQWVRVQALVRGSVVDDRRQWRQEESARGLV